MVEYTLHLDAVFGALADRTRRDILRRVAKKELNVGEIAGAYTMTLAAISKHLKILERAKLVIKRRQGKEQLVRMSQAAVKNAADCLGRYEAMWNGRFDRLDILLKKENKKINYSRIRQ